MTAQAATVPVSDAGFTAPRRVAALALKRTCAICSRVDGRPFLVRSNRRSERIDTWAPGLLPVTTAGLKHRGESSPEDVSHRAHIAVMDDTALGARPLADTQSHHTLRPGERMTVRTCLRCVSLIDDFDAPAGLLALYNNCILNMPGAASSAPRAIARPQEFHAHIAYRNTIIPLHRLGGSTL